MSEQELLAELVKSNKLLTQAVAQLAVQKDAGTAHTAMRMHGNGGIFSTPGLSQDVITANVRPVGIHEYLPEIPSWDLNPLFPSITGFTAPTGSQPSNPCQAGPTGEMKSCILTAKYGRKIFSTKTIDTMSVADKINRGDFGDLVLHGQLLANMGLRPDNLSPQEAVNFLTMAELVIAGHNMEMALSTDIWQGTVATTFPGLDVQIATGIIDTETSVTCPALDSDVKDFNYKDVCGSDLDIVAYLTMMMRFLRNRGEGAGLLPIKWAFVMRPQLWDGLSDCWPCRTMSTNCTNSANTKIAVINDNVAYSERNRIRQGRILPIDGEEYPVILDTGIYEYNNINNGNLKAGQYASSIYIVPLTIQGGYPVTYMNFKNYQNCTGELRNLFPNMGIAVSGDGKWAWAENSIRYCVEYTLRTEQRVVLRTPHLAGKLQHVMYSPLQHFVEPDQNSVYARDGGVSVRGTSAHHSVWD